MTRTRLAAAKAKTAKRARKSAVASERRSYRQFCGVARALDIVGERWTLLLVRNLLLGPRRYSDLLSELPGITTNLLAKRLAELAELGLITREELPAPLAATAYRLSALGASLEPVIMELGRWGGRFLGAPRADDTLNIGWALLSMKRRYLGGLKLVCEIDCDGKRFELAFSPHYLAVQQRAAARPDVRVATSAAGLRAWLFQQQDPNALEAAGTLRFSGEPAAREQLVRAFGPVPSFA
jgi:DNA-binding HxlR family transcriptional regulator